MKDKAYKSRDGPGRTDENCTMKTEYKKGGPLL